MIVLENLESLVLIKSLHFLGNIRLNVHVLVNMVTKKYCFQIKRDFATAESYPPKNTYVETSIFVIN